MRIAFGDRAAAEIASNRCFANQSQRFHQERNHLFVRTIVERFRPIDAFDRRKLWKDCRHGTGIPRIGIVAGHADHGFGIESFAGRLLGARLDPAKEHRRDDPTPFVVCQSPDWRAGRQRTVFHNATRGFDGGGGCPPLPFVLERRDAHLADHCFLAHRGFSILTGAEVAGFAVADVADVAAAAGFATCSTAFHGFLSGVIASSSTFLSV